MTPEQYEHALDSYWIGIDKNQVVLSGYGSAKEWVYIASEIGGVALS
jgi:hypothetical protein